MTQNFEPRLTQAESRLDRIEQGVIEIQRSISDLNSTVATLADQTTIMQGLMSEQSQRLDQFAAEAAQDRHQAAINRTETDRRFEESRQQADRDRALMLQLIQAIAQGRNGS